MTAPHTVARKNRPRLTARTRRSAGPHRPPDAVAMRSSTACVEGIMATSVRRDARKSCAIYVRPGRRSCASGAVPLVRNPRISWRFRLTAVDNRNPRAMAGECFLLPCLCESRIVPRTRAGSGEDVVRNWIHRIGSMKLGIVLLLAVLLAMAAGTIVESAKGSDTAMRAVYGAVWFRLLLGVFGVNLFFSLVDRFPWGRQTIGFALTHGAMLVILVGALFTLTLKVEGHLALWEGEERDVFDSAPEGAPAAFLPLPFSVRLEAFEIDYYQGTHRPAMFRSRVIVEDRERGVRFPAVIQMNHELSYRGYRLFQSSYNQTQGGDQTILAVSKDPGQPVVFIGYGLLVLGMLTVLGTRIAQRRAAARLVAQEAPGRAPRPLAAAIVTLVALLALGSIAPARAGEAPAAALDAPTVDALRRLPVQHDG